MYEKSRFVVAYRLFIAIIIALLCLLSVAGLVLLTSIKAHADNLGYCGQNISNHPEWLANIKNAVKNYTTTQGIPAYDWNQPNQVAFGSRVGSNGIQPLTFVFAGKYITFEAQHDILNQTKINAFLVQPSPNNQTTTDKSVFQVQLDKDTAITATVTSTILGYNNPNAQNFQQPVDCWWGMKSITATTGYTDSVSYTFPAYNGTWGLLCQYDSTKEATDPTCPTTPPSQIVTIDDRSIVKVGGVILIFYLTVLIASQFRYNKWKN